VALDPVYQSYEASNGTVLNEASTYLTTSVPIGQRFTAQARIGYAQMSVGDTPAVQGLTDATGRFLYSQPVGEGSVVIAANLNVPTGKQQLDADAIRTTRFISRNYYDFQVSSFSRGLSVSPQVTWAFPVNDRLALGVGAGYQYQRGYQPTQGLTSDSLYVPGDGIGANAGFDYKITETSALGVDLAVKRYQADRLDGTRRFNAGNRYAGTLRYLNRSGFTTIRAVVRYASWEESEFGYQVGDPDRGQVIPSHAMVLGSYKTRLTDVIDVRVRASGHRYAETLQADAKTFGRLYVAPSFELTDEIVVSPHATGTYGSFAGVGGGVRIEGRI
jgi:hypothetical protein